MKRLDEMFNTKETALIKNIKINSQEVKEGDLFVCIKGFSVDRHEFALDAKQKGAAALVVNKFLNVDIPQIKVKDTNKELRNIVTKFYDYPNKKMTMIGVTGTDGKTSVATIIYQLMNKFINTGYIGTNGITCPGYEKSANNTTPSPEFLYRCFYKFYLKGCQSVAMEVSSEGLAQNRCEGLLFDIAIFTNLTPEHLNYHKTMENYLATKCMLFQQTKKEGYCIINIDDDYAKKIMSKANGNIITYGSQPKADFYFYDIEIRASQTKFKLKYQGEIHNIEMPLLGEFNVYNMTAALAVLVLRGFKFGSLKKHLKTLTIDGRMMSVDLNQDFRVIVDYAHTPNGYLKLLELTKTLQANKTIIVAGSAGERDKEKRPVMGKILVDNADYVIFTKEDPRTEDPNDIVDQLTSSIKNKKEKFAKIIDRKEAINKAIAMAAKGDIVLILGKGNESYHIIGTKKTHFNDVDEAKKALKKRYYN